MICDSTTESTQRSSLARRLKNREFKLDTTLYPPLSSSASLGTQPARSRLICIGWAAVCVVGIAGCSGPPASASGCAGLTGVASIDCQADSKINSTQSPKITAFSIQIKKQPYSDAMRLNAKKPLAIEEKRLEKSP